VRKGQTVGKELFASPAMDPVNETAVAACMACVDLNPIPAGIAATPKASDFTSVQERIEHRQLATDVSTADAQDVQIDHGENAGGHLSFRPRDRGLSTSKRQFWVPLQHSTPWRSSPEPIAVIAVLVQSYERKFAGANNWNAVLEARLNSLQWKTPKTSSVFPSGQHLHDSPIHAPKRNSPRTLPVNLLVRNSPMHLILRETTGPDNSTLLHNDQHNHTYMRFATLIFSHSTIDNPSPRRNCVTRQHVAQCV